MAPSRFIYIFPQQPPRPESPTRRAGWGSSGICFLTASADSIHQNQTEVFKDALSATLTAEGQGHYHSL